MELILTGECHNMEKTTTGVVYVWETFEKANKNLENLGDDVDKILVTEYIDWTWTHVLEHFQGVVTDHGTRVSRAAEVIALMMLAGALGTRDATKILKTGQKVKIICTGNDAKVFLES